MATAGPMAATRIARAAGACSRRRQGHHGQGGPARPIAHAGQPGDPGGDPEADDAEPEEQGDLRQLGQRPDERRHGDAETHARARAVRPIDQAARR